MDSTDTQRDAQISQSVGDFVNATASKAPTPGGGSVAALAGALAAALTQMVGNLTVGRKRFKAVADEAAALRDQAQTLQHKLFDAIEDDITVFNELMVVYKDKAMSADEKATALEAATIKASEVPLNTAQLGRDVALLALDMVKIGNPHAGTDAAAAGFMAVAAVKSAGLNVRINAVNVKDRALAASWLSELDSLEAEVAALSVEIAEISAERGGYA